MGRVAGAFVFIFLLGSVGSSSPILLNYPQLVDLTTHQRATYLLNLRKIFAEIEHRQKTKKKYSLWDSLQKNLNIVESAQAIETRGCLTAGWVGKSFSLSGKRGCLAPNEAQNNCPLGQISCNPALFGEGVCVSTEGDSTTSCSIWGKSAEEVAKLYLENGGLEKNWNQLKKSIEDICNLPDQDEDSCDEAKQRVAELEKNFSWLPKAKLTGVSETVYPPCKVRDQGGLGTCSAFCTLCTLDALSLPLGFRTSANWMSFYSGIQSLCDPEKDLSAAPLAEILNDDGPRDNFQMAMKYGFCDEETFLPYSDHEPESGKSSGNFLNPTFRTQFGISPEDARALFCPGGTVNIDEDISNYKSRLRKLSMKSTSTVDPHFTKCAEESLQTVSKLSEKKISCHGKSDDLRTESVGAVLLIKKRLTSPHLPLAVLLESEKWRDKNGNKAHHCMTLVDFNDAEKCFVVKNSWNLQGERPLKYTGDDRVPLEISYLQCDGATVPATGAPDASKSTGR
jgi:hypothetical protein